MCKVCGAPWKAAPCPQCGYAPAGDGPDVGETEITGDPLAKYARKIADGPEQRKETLQRWLVQLALTGASSGRIVWKWKAVYGVELGREAYFRGLADATHDDNPIVSEWAKAQLARIRRAA